jgi:hypothetical protein
MSKLKNLIGQTFGKLTVIKRAENDPQNRARWYCKCDCGNKNLIIVRSQHLIKGSVKSCGCLLNKREDLTGRKFNKLTVIEPINKDKKYEYKWKCLCDCGNYCIVSASSLKTGHTKSCGCLQGEHHCDSSHIEGRTRLYRIWTNIKQRCLNANNKAYKNYGQRGITICKEWEQSYNSFKQWSLDNGYADNLSIDRIDVNGNYEPSNCRWVNFKTQANNTRVNKLITFNGETLTLAQWRDKMGFKRGVIEYRLQKGWDIEKTLTTPVKQKKQH